MPPLLQVGRPAVPRSRKVSGHGPLLLKYLRALKLPLLKGHPRNSGPPSVDTDAPEGQGSHAVAVLVVLVIKVTPPRSDLTMLSN